MDFAITKMSSKGQIVIPQEMRKGLVEGDKLLVIKSGSQLILKKASELDKSLQQDIERARRADEAIERYESGKGKYTEMSFEKFMEEAKKW